MPDLNPKELGMLGILALLVIYLGIFPGVVLDRIGPSVEKLVSDYNAALDPSQTPEAVVPLQKKPIVIEDIIIIPEPDIVPESERYNP